MFKEILKKNNIDNEKAFIIPSNDQFFSEYVSESKNLLKYFINFTGSNGLAIISKSNKAFFTDGRYTEQAKFEISSEFEIYDYNNMHPYVWLKKQNIKEINFDPLLHTSNMINDICKDIKSIPYEGLLSSYLPLFNEEYIKIYTHHVKYAGETTESKISKVIKLFNTEGIFITNAENISWLLNLRSNAINFCPTLLSNAFIWRSGEVDVFINGSIDQNLKLEKVNFYSLHFLQEYIKKISDKLIQIDPATCCVAYKELFKNIVEKLDPIVDLKAIKNNIEIKGAKKAHFLDGLSVIKFLYWFENQKNINEYEASEKLLEIRKNVKEFMFPSFATISAFASNGAIIHYHPHKTSAKVITNDNLYLLDSGGHYLSGTTDITRVTHLGKPTKEHKKYYTLVLKGNLAINNLKFPIGTTGAEIDSIARQFLWNEEYHYPHGTGHGVGNFLNVHEGPQRIGKNGNYPLKENMIVSNEPGYYKVNEFGIRLENCLAVRKSKKLGFLKFQNLTLVPFERKLIDKRLLNPNEIKSINLYHSKIYSTYAKHIKCMNLLRWLSLKCKTL